MVFMGWESHIVKVVMLSKVIYRSNAIPIKITASFFVDMDKNILQFILKGREQEEQNKLGIRWEESLYVLSRHCIAIIAKAVWSRLKVRHIDCETE